MVSGEVALSLQVMEVEPGGTQQSKFGAIWLPGLSKNQ